MTTLIELKTSDDLNQVWESSTKKPVLLFKHSTTCPISARAYSEYNDFIAQTNDDAALFVVKVIESRKVSNQIAAETNIKHESPQIFLIHDKKVIWHASHGRITQDNIKKELASI